MVTDEQVRLLRKKMSEGKTIQAAAAAAGMSERSAYAWKMGALPSDSKKPRTWRTRPDPFEPVWQTEIVPLLERDENGERRARGNDGSRRAPRAPWRSIRSDAAANAAEARP